MKRTNHTFDSGDINFVSAMRAVGVPPCQKEPCSLVITEDSQYVRFHLLSQSVFDVDTQALSNQWSNPNDSRYEADEGLTWIMAFIKDAKRANCRHAEDFFDHAFCYLKDKGKLPPDAPKDLDECVEFVRNHPEDEPGFVFAFCGNRHWAWKEINNAKRRIMLTRGNNTAIIDTNLETRKQRELLARLEG